MEKCEIQYLGQDYWCRDCYKTKKGTNLVRVDNELYTTANNEFGGEPDRPFNIDGFIIVDKFTNN